MLSLCSSLIGDVMAESLIRADLERRPWSGFLMGSQGVLSPCGGRALC